MNRALICDPQMPRLAEEGRTEEIRACIACNQACIGHFHAGYPISCIQHPETGRERVYGRRHPVPRPRKVMVVGGGPAGLKAAAVAAERGHRVTLYEKGPRVGGQVLLAERLPGREEFGGAATNLRAEAQRAGVTIVTNVTADIDLVRSERPDAAVIATGALPRRPEIEVLGDPRILDAWQVIEGAQVPDGKIVVSDWRADWIGAGVAVDLARRGHEVVLCVNGYAAVQGLQQYVRDAHLAALQRSRVQVIPLVRLFGADDDAVFFQHVLTKEPVVIEEVACLVLAEGHVPVDGLLDALSRELSTMIEVVGIGDCLAPRSVEEAVLEGLQVGAAL